LAIVTSAVPKNVLFSVFSGLANHISTAQLTPFISNMHTALWCLAAVSVVGAVISAARPKHATVSPEEEMQAQRMPSALTPASAHTAAGAQPAPNAQTAPRAQTAPGEDHGRPQPVTS